MAFHDLNQNVVTIHEGSAPRIIHYGEDFWLEDLPIGTRVVYPNPPLASLPDAGAAIRQAINRPLGCDPLHAQLEPGMKVTIAVDDISLPLPPMKSPDIRATMLKIVLQQLRDYGVSDVHIIVATGVHRRMTPAEMKHAYGREVYETYAPDRLYNHDAEAPNGVVKIGEDESGHAIEINRRAAESDLIIYLNINLVPMNGGHKSVGVGLCSYNTLCAHHNPSILKSTESYMEPKRSKLHSVIERIGKVVNEKLNIFHIETVLNNRMYDRTTDFLAKNEDDFTDTDWLKFEALRHTLKRLPFDMKRKLLSKVPAAYQLVAVNAGRTEEVHARTLEKSFQQYSVPVEGQADILITGVPYVSPYSVNSILNPLLVQVMALGYLHNMHRGTPVLKEGGTLILCHPCYDRFDPEHHPSYIEFFNRLLPETTDAFELHKRWEKKFAKDPSYIDRFRNGHAYHGAHPFYMWYWAVHGRRWCGRIIAAGADNERVPRLMGWERAETLHDAIRMARSDAPKDPQITMMHHPPIVIADVKAEG